MEREARLGLALVVAWTGLIAWVFHVVDGVEQAHVRDVAQASGHAIADVITDLRSWASNHGGVYVRSGDRLAPNPYLNVPDRDVVTTDGVRLTLVNPAYLTRELGELGAARSHVQFRLTSERPLRPANAPSPWEVRALAGLREGASEWSELVGLDSSEPRFRYMRALPLEQSCTACHVGPGEVVGSVRGGLTVEFPVGAAALASTRSLQRTGAALLAAWFLGLVLVVTTARNLAQRRRNEYVLRELSIRDPLTGLLNRRGFMEMGTQHLQLAARRGERALVVYVDVDNMKPVNDSFGHDEGDRLLRRVAGVLTMVFRSADVAARLGGDEFAVFLMGADAESGPATLERLRQRVEEDNQRLPDARYRIEVSLGFAELDPHSPETLDALLKRADTGMLGNKKERKRSQPRMEAVGART